MRKIGLHLQVDGSLTSVAREAMKLHLKIFQCFLAKKTVGRVMKFELDDIREFVSLRRRYFDQLYLHSSYWVNLCDADRDRHPLLEKELSLAQRLEFTHVVLHPGSWRGAKNKKDGIDALALSVNRLLSADHGLKVVLENVAHGGKAVGNDLRDFRMLLKKIDKPEKLKFCIDVAHAYLFGYDIAHQEGREQFIQLVDDIMGWENVELIHLNDTKESLGSMIDQHYSVGDGSIGDQALKSFIFDPKIKDIPLIMEVPMLSREQQKNLLEKVRSWHSE